MSLKSLTGFRDFYPEDCALREWLFQAWKDSCREFGFQQVDGPPLEQLELFVDTENLRAIAFYERFGFERIATHKDSVRINGVSRDDYFYTLRL